MLPWLPACRAVRVRGPGPEVATEKISGLRERYGVDDARTLAFFTVHSTLDVEHSGAERDDRVARFHRGR